METKFKLNEEVLIFKSGKRQIATIVERILIKNLDTGKEEIKYFYIVPESNVAYSMEEGMLVLWNQLAVKAEKEELNNERNL